MKKLITVRADKNIGSYTNVTLPLIMEYAKKVGADFQLLSHNYENTVGDGHFHYRIFEIANLLNTYDRVLNLDADIMINKNAPSVFDVVDEDCIGTVLEDKGSRQDHRRQMIAASQKRWGDVGWREGYINSGCIVFSKKHADVFQEINGEVWNEFGFDDVHMAYRIHQLGHKIQELPFTFNHMGMFYEQWNGFPNRFASHMIHYSGKGVFDPIHGNKVAQIHADFETIYGRPPE